MATSMYLLHHIVGTDEKVIWTILTARTNAQRQRISVEYTSIYGRVRDNRLRGFCEPY